MRGNLLCHGQFLIKQWHLSVERREYLTQLVREQKEVLLRSVPTLVDGSRAAEKNYKASELDDENHQKL